MRKTAASFCGLVILLLASHHCSLGDSEDEGQHYEGKSLAAWVSALEDKDPKVRVQTVQAMQSFGPRAKAAVPLLIAMFKNADEERFKLVTGALHAIGAEAVPALVEAAKSKDGGMEGSAVRSYSLSVLITMEPKPDAALPALLQATKHSDSWTRLVAVSLLYHHATDSLKALDAVICALEDKDKLVREQAACGLTYFGPEISRALPVVERMMKGKDREQRGRAMGVLFRIAQKNGPKFKDMTPLLIEGAKDEDSSVRYSAVLALGMVRPPAKVAVPALLEALKDPNKDLQRLAKEALWFIDPEKTEQFRLTSEIGRIEDAKKQAQAALELLLQTADYSEKLRLLPAQLRHTLSDEARSYLVGLLLSKLSSFRPLPLDNLAPTSILSRVLSGKMRSYGWQPMLVQDLYLECGRCAWAVEGVLGCKLPSFTEELARKPNRLSADILRASLVAMEATLRAEMGLKR